MYVCVYAVYLPDTTVYTEKFVEEAHESTLLGGTQLTTTKVRERHWVPRLRRLAKRIIKKLSRMQTISGHRPCCAASWTTP